MPRYPKIQTGWMVQLCTESVGRTLLLQCWRSGGGRHNAAEKALCAICLGNKNSYDLCQILSPKRPYAAPGASLYRGLKNLKQSDCILDFTNSYSGILAPWRFTQWAGLFLRAGISAFWLPWILLRGSLIPCLTASGFNFASADWMMIGQQVQYPT